MINGTVRTHCDSTSHGNKLKKWVESLDDDAQIKANLVEYYKSNSDEHMATLSAEVHLYPTAP